MFTPEATANDGKALLISGWTLFAVSTIVLGLRLYTRLSRVHKIALDDYLMYTSWVSELLHMVFLNVACVHGLGRHFATLTVAEQQVALFYTIGFVEIFAVITCMWGRMSFATLLLYIIGPSDFKKRIALWSVIGVQITINLIVIVQIYAQCGTQVTGLWNYAVAAHAHCQSPMVETIIGYIQSALNSLSDVVLTVLPAVVLWNLSMPLGQRIGLGATLTLSIFAFVASVAKAVQIQNLGDKNDFTWYMINLQLWVCIENNVVMVAASIPTLRPLLRRKDRSSATAQAYTCSENSRRNMSHDPYSQPQDHIARSGRDDPDSNSEEYILQNVVAPGDQITKTTDVHIAYETQSEADQEPEKEHGAPPPRFLRNSYKA